MNKKLVAKQLLQVAKSLLAENLKVKFLENHHGKKCYSIGDDWQAEVGTFSTTYFKRDPSQFGKYDYDSDVYEEVPFNKVPDKIKNIKLGSKSVIAKTDKSSETVKRLDKVYHELKDIYSSLDRKDNWNQSDLSSIPFSLMNTQKALKILFETFDVRW